MRRTDEVAKHQLGYSRSCLLVMQCTRCGVLSHCCKRPSLTKVTTDGN